MDDIKWREAFAKRVLTPSVADVETLLSGIKTHIRQYCADNTIDVFNVPRAWAQLLNHLGMRIIQTISGTALTTDSPRLYTLTDLERDLSIESMQKAAPELWEQVARSSKPELDQAIRDEIAL